MLPVLMYHGIHADPDSEGRFDPVYSVTPEAFAAQLFWLRQAGYRSMRLSELDQVNSMATDAKAILITFDDGDVSNYDVALPLLREYAMHAEFFITSDFVDKDGMLTSEKLRALSAAGMGVQSHGRSHAFLSELDAPELRDELIESRKSLETIGGQPVRALALPGGRGGEREFALARELGYREIFNSLPGINRRWNGKTYLERIAMTRDMSLTRFADLVRWRGLAPRFSRARYRVLQLPKQLLGNGRYQRLRQWILAR
jgi:peptidoglycan/xylan/chitin deacetylase (PgdA/CDA1 family)